MKSWKKAIKAAFPVTVPVLLGYLFIGIAFGVLLHEKGYHAGWAVLMSLCVYAGSMQFVAINFFVPGVNFLSVILMTLMVNARHVFYGLSMLRPFQKMGKLKPYMIFSLTDETYSLLCGAKVPEGVDSNQFFFSISLLDQLYWIAGSALGGLAGSLFTFDTTGIDFAMTALFVVIFVEQWLAGGSRYPALAGVGAAVVCLVIFGPEQFILPAMLVIVLLLLAGRRLADGQKAAEKKEGDA